MTDVEKWLTTLFLLSLHNSPWLELSERVRAKDIETDRRREKRAKEELINK